jgi:hypothetical protein
MPCKFETQKIYHEHKKCVAVYAGGNYSSLHGKSEVYVARTPQDAHQTGFMVHRIA